MSKWVAAALVVALGTVGYAQELEKTISSYTRQSQRSDQQNYGYSYEKSQPQTRQNSQDQPYGRQMRPQDNMRKDPSRRPGQPHHPHLTTQEEKFASWLSPMHQRVFVEMFTPQMRQAAMELASFRFYDMDGPSGSISPDQAVELVMSKVRRKPVAPHSNTKGPYQGREKYRSYAPQAGEGSRYRSYGRSDGSEESSSPRVSPYQERQQRY